MVFYDLDRLVRQPRDLEALIDIIEYVQRPAISATGGRMKLRADLASELARKEKRLARRTSGSLTEAGLTEEDHFRLVAATNRKVSALQDALTAADTPRHAGTQTPETSEWRNGTANQRRALLRRYLHGVTVLPPLKPGGGNPTERLPARLRPTWKTTQELAA